MIPHAERLLTSFANAVRVALAPTATALALVLVSCNETVDPDARTDRLIAIAGDDQTTLPGGRVPRPLIVRAVDAQGLPRAGVLIRWQGSNGSSFVSDTATTDADGRALGVWRVGTQASYTATASADSVAAVTFEAHTDPGALVISAAPDTVRFHALDDTAQVRIRIRTADGQLDTLVNPDGAGWGSDAVAIPTFAGPNNFTLLSKKNGSSLMHLRFGLEVWTLVHLRVQQVPAAVRIVPAGTTEPAADTIVIGPDSVMTLALRAVDSRGRVIANDSALLAATWESSKPEVAAMSGATVQAVGDGFTTLTAHADTFDVQSHLRVWTMEVRAIEAGGSSTCALLATDGVACWGKTHAGSLTSIDKDIAPRERFGGPFTALSLSDAGGCVLTPAGAAQCWGTNSLGRLGTGSTGPYQSSPVPVSGGLTFASVETSSSSTCGLTSSGDVYCWGMGYDGKLGDGTYGAADCGDMPCRVSPTRVAGERTYTQLSVGGSHACAVATDGRGYCWGSNRYGQLGSTPERCAGHPGGDSTGAKSSWCSRVPVEVSGHHRFATIAAGSAHTCGVTTDGALYCWGLNIAGVLGVPELSTQVGVNAQPLRVAAGQSFASVVAGWGHTCAIDTQGAAWCWGQVLAGQLGTNTTGTPNCTNGPCELAPVRVAGGHTFKALTIGGPHTCGITTVDVAYCWGWGEPGSLGTGARDDRRTPARVVFQKP